MMNHFIDFTAPYYHKGGITVLLKRPVVLDQNFLFIAVFTNDLWACIFAAIVVVSALLYIFDQSRPLSAEELQKQNGEEAIHWDFRQYNLLDSIWIIFGAFTAAGG
jgi:hypothetical protein